MVFLKLFERIYAPLTAGRLQSVPVTPSFNWQRSCQLDRLYQRVPDDPDKLFVKIGLNIVA